MKGFGIACLVMAGICLIALFTAMAQGAEQGIVVTANGLGIWGFLGAFLISRAKKKKEEQCNKNKWNKEE